MRRHSPYNYAFNNPIYLIDPDGMMLVASKVDGGISISSGGDIGSIEMGMVPVDPPTEAGTFEGQSHYDPDTGASYEWDGENNAWHSYMAGMNQLDQVNITGSSSESNASSSGGGCPQGNCDTDINSITQGLKGGEALLTFAQMKVDDFASTFKVVPKEILNLQKFVKVGGAFVSVAGMVMDIHKYEIGEISQRRLGFRLTGTGTSIGVGLAYGTGWGVAAYMIFSAGEYAYDGIKATRAYNKEAEASNFTMDQNGNVKKNRQNLSIESIEYHMGWDN